ncbi:phosphotransferase enzyme family protein [Ornithinibacillus scapharcae]|uniref:phosphotransferase enzyme family protein n=1 Tax=Ornithinibacillus scapharcae TaxID=1147159 RepID=UPI000225BC97|nr:phosphotransferase [Ornithinibacillus scapharcae]
MNHKIVSKGANLFNARVNRLIGGFSNNVFECHQNDDVIILKYYHGATNHKESILAELDWIKYLHQSGVNVTAPLPSVNGNFIEIINDIHNEEFYVTAFEKAKGSLVETSNSDVWNTELFYCWGKTLGRIHSLSKTYRPSDEGIKKEWNNGILYSANIGGVSKKIIKALSSYINEMNKFPTDTDSYGMIHHDLHHQNFYINGKDIVLFDFGDCEYHWFAYDIAIVIYHAVQTINQKNTQGRKEFAIRFSKSFLQGYATENRLDEYWISKIPFFLNYRQVYSYIYLVNFLGKEQKSNNRVKDVLEGMKTRI